MGAAQPHPHWPAARVGFPAEAPPSPGRVEGAGKLGPGEEPGGEIEGGEAPAEEPGWDAVSREMGKEPLRAPHSILSSTEGTSEGRQSPGPDGASGGADMWGQAEG